MLERARDQIAVPTPDGGTFLVDPRQHRAHVVRRLLCCGVAPSTLMHLLPEWSPLILRIDRQLAATGVTRQGPGAGG